MNPTPFPVPALADDDPLALAGRPPSALVGRTSDLHTDPYLDDDAEVRDALRRWGCCS